MEIVVAGAGLAAARTVAELRRLGHRGRITVLGAEGVPPYDRPLLSKELFTRTQPAWLASDVGIDLASLADDVRWDIPARSLTLADRIVVGTSAGDVAADALVVATGSQPIAIPGALAFRTAADAADLRERATPGSRVVIVGGGWIGCELAATLSAAGVGVVVVEAAPSLLSAALPPTLGARVAGWLSDAGVDVRTGVGVASAERSVVALTDGATVTGDVVVAAVGVRPATTWLAGSGLDLDARGAVRTSSSGMVTEPGREARRIAAVGDAATRTSRVFGVVPGGHWDFAWRMGPVVAAALLGEPVPDDPVPYVFSTIGKHDVGLVGLTPPDAEVVVREGPVGFSALWLRGDVLTGALLVDQPREVAGARKVLAAGPVAVEAGLVADGARGLRQLVRR